MRISRVEVLAVAPPVERYRWSDDLPEQFMTNTVVRIEVDTGQFGTGGVWNGTSFEHDRYTAENNDLEMKKSVQRLLKIRYELEQ